MFGTAFHSVLQVFGERRVAAKRQPHGTRDDKEVNEMLDANESDDRAARATHGSRADAARSGAAWRCSPSVRLRILPRDGRIAYVGDALGGGGGFPRGRRAAPA